MRGLCHVCLSSNVEVIIEKGQILCIACLEKKRSKKD